jgi:methyltransferase-like protein
VQAAEPGVVTTLSHMSTELSVGDRFVLRLCDGSRTRSELAREVAAAAETGDLRIAAADGSPVTGAERIAEASNAETEAAVLRLGSLGLFVAPRPDV